VEASNVPSTTGGAGAAVAAGDIGGGGTTPTMPQNWSSRDATTAHAYWASTSVSMTRTCRAARAMTRSGGAAAAFDVAAIVACSRGCGGGRGMLTRGGGDGGKDLDDGDGLSQVSWSDASC
jgi:hypothetical protein